MKNEVYTQWNLGNFTVTLSTPVTEAQLGALADLGLRFLGQRQSTVDKVLGGFEKGENGKLQRKKGWKRIDAAYSAELSEALAKEFAELEVEDGSKLSIQNVTIGEYVPNTPEAKFVDERAAMSRHESMTGGKDSPSKLQELEVWMRETIGYDGAIWTEDEEDYSVDALKAVRQFAKSI